MGLFALAALGLGSVTQGIGPGAVKPARLAAGPVPDDAGARTLSSELTATLMAPVQMVKKVAVSRGDTLMSLLTSAGADSNESQLAINALVTKVDPRKLQPGQEITVTFERGEQPDSYRLTSLNMAPSVERQVSVNRADSGFAAQEVIRTFDRAPARAGGVIRDSLYNAAMDAGIPSTVLAEMIRIFSYYVDFQRDVQPGDRFDVFFERFLDDAGKAVKTGRIHSASMTLRGQELRYYLYKPSDEGDADYFTASGQSIRKALLRTPIDGARLTSSFGMRNHPIMGYSIVHKGVDFGAPTGTPIQAAGDGVVEAAGPFKGYGNYVRLHNNGTYSTAYAHMSRIVVKVGQRVRQGQVIGYVGQTGLATGPHLHYEVMVNNKQVNPQSVRLPTGRKLDGAEFARYQKSLLQINQEIAATPQSNLLAGN